MIYIFCIYFILFVYVLRCFDNLPNLSGWGAIAPPGAPHFSVGSMPLHTEHPRATPPLSGLHTPGGSLPLP